jgi:hypothetical protein
MITTASSDSCMQRVGKPPQDALFLPARPLGDKVRHRKLDTPYRLPAVASPSHERCTTQLPLFTDHWPLLRHSPASLHK